MENNLPTYCTQCPNHCPADDLHCRRGQAYFANLRGESSEFEGGYDHQSHDKEFHGHHEEHHRHHEEHHGNRHPHFEINENSSLETLLRACGHRLHHGMPGGPHGSQEKLLQILNDQGGRADQRELQERMRIRPASASELLAKLEEKGLVERRKDEEDRRRVQVMLTEEGLRKAHEEGIPEENGELFQGLTDEEQKALKDLLLKLLESWK